MVALSVKCWFFLLSLVVVATAAKRRPKLWLPIETETNTKNTNDELIANDMVTTDDGGPIETSMLTDAETKNHQKDCRRKEQDLEDWYQISRDVLEYECGATPPSPIPPADQKQESPPEEISIMDEKTAPPGFPPFPFETIQDSQMLQHNDQSPKIDLLKLDSSAIAACVANTNQYRRKHLNTPDLVWDTELAADAGKWAKHLMELSLKNGKTELVHRGTDGSGEGENLYWSIAMVDCQHANKAWYLERADYDYQRQGPKAGWSAQSIRHFAQLVWKGSKKFGLAIARGKFGKYWKKFKFPQFIVVARYSPAETDNQGYGENVQPLA